MRDRSDATEPVRTCIGCRERRPASALMRITRSADGFAVDGASSGRGAWLCRGADSKFVEPRCLETAIAKRSFARAWKGAVSAAEHQAIRDRVPIPSDAGEEETGQPRT